ncbi:hypothetical protein HPB50_001819 [Hyalomma asiaticum]|uniref:Uncharacterized protein n=1 Tax=Hyalomma asiaticum TaxID=266040 RepID=A0ACB7SUX1_HYAAI|nr:hypothetical protein HPB50_001819 [Hyalomma asiaticum]
MNAAPKKPHLPKEDIKVIIRPKDDFNTAGYSVAQIGDCILRATGLKPEEVVKDSIRINERQDIGAQYLINKERPDILISQETNGKAKLSGYPPYGGATRKTSAVTTLVRRNLTAVQHDTESKDIEHTLIEIIPTRKVASSLFVLNVYSSPRRKHWFGMLIRKAIAIAGKRTILIAGDFNAQHTARVYRFENVKGTNLWLDEQQEGLTVLAKAER